MEPQHVYDFISAYVTVWLYVYNFQNIVLVVFKNNNKKKSKL